MKIFSFIHKVYIYLILLSCIATLSISMSYASSPNDQAIRDIISKMTIEEKFSQISTEDGGYRPIESLGLYNYNWRNEATHGINYWESTIFPHVIGQAAMFDRQYIIDMANAQADEARIMYKKSKGDFGVNIWSPHINIAHDPRWGRLQETYGEDPYMVSEYGYIFITATQGNHDYYKRIICSPKHLIAYSYPENERYSVNVNLNEKDLYETHLPPFKRAIVDAKAASIMPGFNALNGVPMHANKFFLDTLLRQEWKFDGFVVSDCWGIALAEWGHNYFGSAVNAGIAALEAGIDLECGLALYNYLLPEIDSVDLDLNIIDTALYRLLDAKYKMGVLGNLSDFPFPEPADSLLRSQKHLEISLRGAQESIVLMQNKNNILPLTKDKTRVFVTGPNSYVHWEMFGNYHGYYTGWEAGVVRIAQAMRDEYKDTTMVKYAWTCDAVHSPTITADTTWFTADTLSKERGFFAEYFTNDSLGGEPAFTRIDKAIKFDWKDKAPFDAFPVDSFSVRWTGYITPDTTDFFTFRLRSDDGFNLYINDTLAIEAWDFDRREQRKTVKQLDSGVTYQIRLEYRELEWDAWMDFGVGNSNTWNEDIAREADSLAAMSDVILFVGGITPEFESEVIVHQSEPMINGDRRYLELPTIQRKFIRRLKASGKPVILAIMGGSSYALEWEKENLDGILDIFYPGEFGGKALASVVFGDVNPSGKLPLTFYRSTEDLPPMSDYSMKNRTYRYCEKPVLFPFGYGLSYTTYEYTDAKVEKQEFTETLKDSIRLSVKVKNTGKRDGKEAVQIYAAKPGSKNYDAIKTLVEFDKKLIKAGEEVEYTFSIPLERLCYWDTTTKKYEVENGDYMIYVGASSQDIKSGFKVSINVEKSSVSPSDEAIRFRHNQALNQIEVFAYYGDKEDVKLYDLLGKEQAISKKKAGNTLVLTYPQIANGAYILQIDKEYHKILINK